MKWLNPNNSDRNIEDKRGSGGGRGLAFGGIGTIIAVIIALLLGQNPFSFINSVEQMAPQQETAPTGPRPDDALAQHAKYTFNSCNDIWANVFTQQLNKQYQNPTLKMFTGSTRSGCGGASSAMGPFYCPADGKVYLDLTFFNELAQRFNAKGDLAQSYVVAHEVGHHVQNLLGITQQMEAARGRLSQAEYNQLSVKLELQADFLAGLWTHYAEKNGTIGLEPGDIESALQAANAIGDDNIQKQTQGYVVPESFTHGSSAERVYWFKKGYTSGDLSQGDTFNSSLN
ncbi:neutral zinc metallopeptidase [Haoranjiania flava]|uniref:Zinc metallopeptidase n=1 Tax=Haoranjiania flava TaxID=1856322 RepID=A0AAE3IQ87_9BACT|nr:neutral zinc metallopeptidase [Haoranjiania flava]MCU7693812.1 zinc metallopeptidase [Haoranjiania flava]